MKMALKVMEKKISVTEDIPIIVVRNDDILSYVKGYHVYKNVWTSCLQEQVQGETETNNGVDKYAVAVKNDGKIVGDLPGRIENLQKQFLISFELIRTKRAI